MAVSYAPGELFGRRAHRFFSARHVIDADRLVGLERALEIELLGDLAGILALSADGKKPVTEDRDGLQITLVAGIGFEPMTFRL